jgi:ubiquinone/menaquinone biosynthesis C-methylase UbiE
MEENSKVKQRVQEQFSRTAEQYVTSSSHAQGSDLSLMLEWIAPSPDWIALDIATGGGHVARTLSPHVHHVVATDLTPAMLSAAAGHLREKGCRNVTYVVADAENLPFLSESFDLVTCRIAAHHFPNPQLFVRETARVLRPGGHFLLIDNVAPNTQKLSEFMNRFEKMRDNSHMKCASTEEWLKWMREAGFTEVKSRLRKKRYDFPEWVKRAAKSPEQMEEVERFLINADQETAAYFAIETDGKRVVSLQVDEWMILCSPADTLV